MKDICIKENIYRYELKYGSKILYTEKDGLDIMKFNLNDAEDILDSIKEIMQYLKRNE